MDIKQIMIEILKSSVTRVVKTIEFNGIDLMIDKGADKIVVWGINPKSQKYANLKANKYTELFSKLEEVSDDIYYYEGKYHISIKPEHVIKANQQIGYCRVSCAKQLDGNGIEVQRTDILNRYPNADIVEEQYTGSKKDRPKLNEVLDKLYEGDTLIVTKLDRLARNTVEGIQIAEDLFKKGVSIHVLNLGLLENTSMGKFFLTTLLAVAEMERNTIIERTQAGKEIARTKAGYKDGRPEKFTKHQIEYALSLLDTNSYTEVEKMTRISKSTLIRAKRKKLENTQK